MYTNLSNFAEGVDTAFVVILGVIIFFLVALTIALIYFIIRYREKRNPKATEIEGNVKLELLWTGIPLLLVIGMFYYGWIGWKPMMTEAPKDAMEVDVSAEMWSWRFKYANGKKTDTLYVPRGKAVKLNMKSLDVIHSLYIPAFRLKQDIVPGEPAKMWFIANAPGSYDLFCTEYCGLQHSYMYTSVNVLPEDKFEDWYGDTTQVKVVYTTPGAEGFQILKDNGCLACHSTDGSKLVGPTYRGIFGHEVEVVTGGKKQLVMVDKEYIKNSIYNPNQDVVVGYKKDLMRSYQDQVSEEDIDKIIVYLETLSKK